VPLTSSARQIYLSKRTRRAGGGESARKFLRRVSDFRSSAVRARHQPARITLRLTPKRAPRSIVSVKRGHYRTVRSANPSRQKPGWTGTAPHERPHFARDICTEKTIETQFHGGCAAVLRFAQLTWTIPGSPPPGPRHGGNSPRCEGLSWFSIPFCPYPSTSSANVVRGFGFASPRCGAVAHRYRNKCRQYRHLIQVAPCTSG
jgi:hypothetical protein